MTRSSSGVFGEGSGKVPGPAAPPGLLCIQVLNTAELLALILENCTRQELAVACQVNSTWDAIVGEHTHFGALVCYNPRSRADIDLLARCLQRGGQRKVFVWIPTMNDCHPERILSVVAQHSSRIKGLAFGQLSQAELELVWKSMGDGMSNLVELALHGKGFKHPPDVPPTITLPALVKSAPQLCRLVCSGIPLQCSNEVVEKLDVIEFSPEQGDLSGTALGFWSAPWRDNLAIVGLAIREAPQDTPQQDSWVATAWTGCIERANLDEIQLIGRGIDASLGAENRSPYRRIVMNEALQQTAFSIRLNDLTILSMSLYFWGLTRAHYEDIQLPQLKLLHLMLIDLGDASVGGTGILICPRLTNVALQVDKLFEDNNEGDNEEDIFGYFLACTHQELEQLMDTTFKTAAIVTIDLFSDGFELSGTSNRKDLQFRTCPGRPTFQSWARAIGDV